MRVCIITVCALLAGFVASCKSEDGPSKSPTTRPAATQPAGATAPAAVAITITNGAADEVTVNADGAPVLVVRLPAGSKTFGGEKAIIASDKDLHRFYLWVVPGAKTLGEAAAMAPEIIKSEFLELHVMQDKDIKAAGVDAKQIDGSGKEADDGDAGNAEIVLFQLGGHVFAACVHGEGDAPALHRPFMMSVLDTARVFP